MCHFIKHWTRFKFFLTSWHVSQFRILLSWDERQIIWYSIFILCIFTVEAYNIKEEADHSHQQKMKWDYNMLALIFPSNNYLGYMHILKVRFELIKATDPSKCKKGLWILTWTIFNKINCNWAYKLVDFSFKGYNPDMLFLHEFASTMCYSHICTEDIVASLLYSI